MGSKGLALGRPQSGAPALVAGAATELDGARAIRRAIAKQEPPVAGVERVPASATIGVSPKFGPQARCFLIPLAWSPSPFGSCEAVSVSLRDAPRSPGHEPCLAPVRGGQDRVTLEPPAAAGGYSFN